MCHLQCMLCTKIWIQTICHVSMHDILQECRAAESQRIHCAVHMVNRDLQQLSWKLDLQLDMF